jgi:hypothetical protein
LADIFPEIGINDSKFSPKGMHQLFLPFPFGIIYFISPYFCDFVVSWGDNEVRRAFFEKYAQQSGFDPLDAAKWYSQPIEKIMATTVPFFNVNFHCIFF